MNELCGAVPFRTIDLDRSPETRWTALVREYRSSLKEAVGYVEQLFQGHSWMQSFFCQVLSTCTSAGWVMYHRELKSIAQEAGIDVGLLTLLQLVYEAAACCTSVVVPSDAADSHPILARTMDWDAAFLRRLTVQLEFRRMDQTVFVASTWVGYVGCLTCMRPGAFAVSVNFRLTEKGSYWTNLKQTLKYAWPVGFLVRHVCEQSDTYSDAVSVLCRTQLIAPCYLTICGTRYRESTIVTRTPTADENRCHGTTLVQTNMDHWKQHDGRDILSSHARRSTAWDTLHAMHEKATYDSLWKLLSTRPILQTCTIYGTLMDPNRGWMETRLSATRALSPSIPTPMMSVVSAHAIEHRGMWHSKFGHCHPIKCARGLGWRRLGRAHWSCCFSADRRSVYCTSS